VQADGHSALAGAPDLQTWDELFAYARSRGTTLNDSKTNREYLTATGWTWHPTRRIESVRGEARQAAQAM